MQGVVWEVLQRRTKEASLSSAPTFAQAHVPLPGIVEMIPIVHLPPSVSPLQPIQNWHLGTLSKRGMNKCVNLPHWH